MPTKELPNKLKAHLDKIRTSDRLGDGGRQSLSCPIPCHPLIKKTLDAVEIKENKDPSRLLDNTPLNEIPIAQREFEYIEVKTGSVGFGDAVKIIAKQTIFLVVSTANITDDAKELFRAAGIIYVEMMSKSEVRNWRKYNIFDLLTRLKRAVTM